MIKRNTNQPVQGSKNNRHGGSLVALEAGVVVEVVVQTLVFPNHVGTSISNDNYRKVHLVNTRLTEQVHPNQTVNSSLLGQFNCTKRLPVQSSSGCILSCCRSCTFCSMSWAPTKERVKSHCIKEQNKSCQRCFCVNPCVSVPHVHSVPSVVPSLAVGGRFQKFWQKWLDLGANPRVVSILREGYTLPFKMRPPLTRSPVVLSSYANPVKNLHLKEALLALMQKLVVEKVVVRSSLAFYGYS